MFLKGMRYRKEYLLIWLMKISRDCGPSVMVLTNTFETVIINYSSPSELVITTRNNATNLWQLNCFKTSDMWILWVMIRLYFFAREKRAVSAHLIEYNRISYLGDCILGSWLEQMRPIAGCPWFFLPYIKKWHINPRKSDSSIDSSIDCL